MKFLFHCDVIPLSQAHVNMKLKSGNQFFKIILFRKKEYLPGIWQLYYFRIEYTNEKL